MPEPGFDPPGEPRCLQLLTLSGGWCFAAW